MIGPRSAPRPASGSRGSSRRGGPTARVARSSRTSAAEARAPRPRTARGRAPVGRDPRACRTAIASTITSPNGSGHRDRKDHAAGAAEAVDLHVVEARPRASRCGTEARRDLRGRSRRARRFVVLHDHRELEPGAPRAISIASTGPLSWFARRCTRGNLLLSRVPVLIRRKVDAVVHGSEVPDPRRPRVARR